MYYKVIDKKNHVFVFKIMKDKNLHYEQNKDDYWRIVNITSGSILVPTFKNIEEAERFLMDDKKSWKVSKIDLSQINMIVF